MTLRSGMVRVLVLSCSTGLLGCEGGSSAAPPDPPDSATDGSPEALGNGATTTPDAAAEAGAEALEVSGAPPGSDGGGGTPTGGKGAGCATDAECGSANACPPGAVLGCACVSGPTGASMCVPACEADADCAASPTGKTFTCKNGACAPASGGGSDTGGTTGEVAYDVTFCTTTGGDEIQMDFYPATIAGGPFPLVVVVHGGGFVKGDKSTAEGLLAQPGLNERGISVMAVNYRFASEVSLEYMAGDVKCAIRYARRNASSLNIDADRIGITGSSAGGYLANLTAVVNEAWDAQDYVDPHLGYSSAVQSLVDWYGATDVTYEFAGFPAPVRQSLLGSMSPDEATLLLASPAYQVDAADPPALIMNGVDDVVIPPEQAQTFYDAYVAAGATAELVLVENGMHGFVPTDGTESSPTLGEIIEMTEEWFESTLAE